MCLLYTISMLHNYTATLNTIVHTYTLMILHRKTVTTQLMLVYVNV